MKRFEEGSVAAASYWSVRLVNGLRTGLHLVLSLGIHIAWLEEEDGVGVNSS